jgi:hypothetical protein
MRKSVLAKLLSVVLAAVMAVGLVPISPTAASLVGSYGPGGKFLAPIEAPDPRATPIYTAQDLDNVRNNLSGMYVLANDIDLSNYNNGEWEPIASTGAPFNGYLDGQGYTIFNLKVTQKYNWCGLFSYISDATIKNVSLENTVIAGPKNSRVGSIAGYVLDKAATIYNCVNNGTIACDYGSAGGILGAYDYKAEPLGSVSFCANSGTVKLNSNDGGSVGGIVGAVTTFAYNGSTIQISNCYNSATVTSTSNSGGIVGIADAFQYYSNYSIAVDIINCDNNGSVSGDTAGGIVGRAGSGGVSRSNLSILNSHNSGIITAVKSGGGIVADAVFGERYTRATITVDKCTNDGNIFVQDRDSKIGGIVASSGDESTQNIPSLGSILSINDCTNNGILQIGGTGAVPMPSDIIVEPVDLEIEVGKTYQLKATVMPQSADQAVTWGSLDSKIASVSGTGLVTAKAPGLVFITAYAAGGDVMNVCTVTVIPAKEINTRKFVIGEDNYPFINWRQSFGYNDRYSIPEERYRMLYSAVQARELYKSSSEHPWGGSCFGFSSSSLLLNIFELTASDYQNGVPYAHLFATPGTPNSRVTQLIEMYQISWGLPGICSTANINRNNYNGLVSAVRAANGEGVVLTIAKNKDLAAYHAIVAYDITEDNGVFDLKIYDCNYPDEIRTMSVNTLNKTFKYYDYGEDITALFEYVTAAAIDNAVDTALMEQANPTNSRPRPNMTILAPRNAAITANGVSVSNINGAYEVIAPAYMKGAPERTTTMWYVPDGKYSVTPNKASEAVTFFDEDSSFEVVPNSVNAVVTGNTESVSINAHMFEMTYITTATIDEPLVITGDATGGFSAEVSGDIMRLTGNTAVKVSRGGKSETVIVDGTAAINIIGSYSTDQPSSWANAEVEEAAALGLVTSDLANGYGKVTTRAEFCRAAVNWLRICGYAVDSITPQMFADTNDREIGIAAALGITNGTGRNMFSPDNPLTREQAATLLNRMLATIGIDINSGTIAWTDASGISDWAVESASDMYSVGVIGGTDTSKLVFSPKSQYTHEQSILTLLRLWKYVNA